MDDIYVYASDCEDFDNIGLCGALTPTSCVFSEEANGISEIAMEHPIDDLKKYRDLAVGNIIKCSVPVRVMPKTTITQQDIYSVYKYYYGKIKTYVGTNRKLYKNSDGNGVLLKVIPATTEVEPSQQEDVRLILIREGENRYYVSFTIYKTDKRYDHVPFTYSGWVEKESVLTDDDWYTVDEDKYKGIESASGSWRIMEQLFRISNVDIKNTGVSVSAQHIFYDLLGNISQRRGQGTCAQQCQYIISSTISPNEFSIYTDVSSTRAYSTTRYDNPVSAILGESTGVCALFGAEILRDNYNIFIAQNAGYDRGVVIEYGKNLLGVTQTIDSNDVVSSICAIGQTKKGEELYFDSYKNYTTEKYMVRTGNRIVSAKDVKDLNGNYLFPDAVDYDVPKIEYVDCSSYVKATGTSSAALETARKALVDAAIDQFVSKKNYINAVTVEVNFVSLGDTEEYRQYKKLESVHLYDTVTIRDTRVGISATAKVNRVDFNVLTGRMNAIKLGTATANLGTEKISQAQIPASVTSIINTTNGTADYASDTAESKCSTYRSETPPTEPNTGDIWIYSKNDTEIQYRYAGDSWVIIQDGTLGSVKAEATNSRTQASETESIVSKTDSVGENAHNIFLNGGIDGNMNHGIWCPRERIVSCGCWTRTQGTSEVQNALIRITSEMVQEPYASHGVGIKLSFTRLSNTADVESYQADTTFSHIPIVGFEMSESMKKDTTYAMKITTRYRSPRETPSTYSGEAWLYAVPGNLDVIYGSLMSIGQRSSLFFYDRMLDDRTFRIGAVQQASEEMENNTKNTKYVGIYMQTPFLVDYFDVGDTFTVTLFDATLHNTEETESTNFSDSKAIAYTQETTKTKLTQENGFVVSGYENVSNSVQQISTQTSLTPKSINVSDRSTGTSIVEMKDGAADTGNGVAAGGTKAITISSWTNNAYTASIEGLKADATVIVSPAPASIATCAACNVRCTSQAAGSITFECDTEPSEDVTMNVLMLGGLASWS